ncbi:substrate-binding domain-containing protein [Mycobacterium sp. 21AC1]|uniref:LacI family DNA-binding transcriptional regulator n=1 Tax=[Mycobacterium] appelbergii TaxID=2939269 RepID=UPI0029394288|nr:substrate-binding domain-containing protein [Mycobacterium sp. 21AC1]MDV3128392.1 substrate-binding domain-containing protein [Mycobacterium sp. 21AC1]
MASHAGLHPSTVSRALSDVPVGVSKGTVARVRSIADELGYFRDITGAALRTGRTRMIGVLVPRLTDVVLAQIYESIDDTARAAGYNTVVANTRDDPEVQRMRLDGLLSRRVDGLIVGDLREGDALVDRILASGVPFVLVMRRGGRHPSVTTDDLEGGRLAAEHFLELGHSVVGVIAGDPLTSTGRERRGGFVGRYAESGIDIPDRYVVDSAFDLDSGRSAAEGLLALTPRPTAVFAVNDFTAIGAIGALRELDLELGRDVAVLGYNDVPVAAQLSIPLSSIRSPLEDMGRLSTEMLLDRLEGRQMSSIRLSPTLVARASTLLSNMTKDSR